MKCPKCGFNSFEHLENCKKCGSDLSQHKTRFSLRSLLFPGRETAPFEEPSSNPQEPGDPVEPAASSTATDFGFDFMGPDEKSEAQPAETSLYELLGDDESPAGEKPGVLPEEDPEVGETFDFDLPPADDLPFGEEPGGLPEEAGDSEAFAFGNAEGELSLEEESAPPEEAASTGEAFDFDLPHGDDLPFGEEPEDLAVETAASERFSFDRIETEFSSAEEIFPSGKVASTGEALDFALPPGDDLPFGEEPEDTAAKAGDSETFSFDGSEPVFSPEEEIPSRDAGAVDELELAFDLEEAPDEESGEERHPSHEDSGSPFEQKEASPESGRNDCEEERQDEFRLTAPEEDGANDENLAEIFLGSIDAEEEDRREEEAIDSGPLAVDFSFPDDEAGTIPAETAVEPSVKAPQNSGGSVAEEDSENSGGQLSAPLGARLAAGVVDLGILSLVFALFLTTGKMALSTGPEKGLFPSPATLADLAIPYFLILFAVCFGYFTLFHFLTGQTPGKMLFKLRVESEQGMSLRLSQAFLRSVGGLLSLIPAGLGYVRILLDRERRGWNDRLAGSRVVPAGESVEGANP